MPEDSTNIDTTARPSTPPPQAPADTSTKSPPPKRQKRDPVSLESTLIVPTAASTMAESEVPAMQVKRLSEHASLPTRGSAFAAGYDLYAAKDTSIPARGKAMVPTDISIAVPAGTYGRVAPRSGLAAKHGLQTGAGVIDADYRGPVMVLLFNHSDNESTIKKGDRCAQLVLERIVNPEVLEVEDLPETVRGAGGFGSTGGFGESSAKPNGAAKS